jgi:hypothetical protein
MRDGVSYAYAIAKCPIDVGQGHALFPLHDIKGNLLCKGVMFCLGLYLVICQDNHALTMGAMAIESFSCIIDEGEGQLIRLEVRDELVRRGAGCISNTQIEASQ